MTAMAAEPDRSKKISREDIEAKLREIRGQVDDTAQAAKPAVMAVAAVAVVLVVGTVYLLGRRRGRKRSTVVEIRRV
jgi:signal transduction histidine kinase